MARAQHRQKHAQIRIVRTESHCFLYIGNSRFRLAAELRRSLIGAGAVALGGMVLWGLQKASAGISFDALDNQPVNLVMLFLVPQGQFQKHLHTLANIAKLLHRAEFRQALEQAPDSEAMLKIIREQGRK